MDRISPQYTDSCTVDEPSHELSEKVPTVLIVRHVPAVLETEPKILFEDNMAVGLSKLSVGCRGGIAQPSQGSEH